MSFKLLKGFAEISQRRFQQENNMEFKHKSVLLEETIEGLDIKPDGIYVDGTLGGAGHAGEVCKMCIRDRILVLQEPLLPIP